MKLHRQRFRHSVVLALSLHIFIITVRNEVAKLMFLHVSVILSTWGVGVPGPGGVCSQGVPGLGGACSGGVAWSGGDGGAWSRGAGIPACTEVDPPGETATAADVTHPTGMHSYYKQGTTD